MAAVVAGAGVALTADGVATGAVATGGGVALVAQAASISGSSRQDNVRKNARPVIGGEGSTRVAAGLQLRMNNCRPSGHPLARLGMASFLAADAEF